MRTVEDERGLRHIHTLTVHKLSLLVPTTSLDISHVTIVIFLYVCGAVITY